MANHASSEKRARQDIKRQDRNARVISRVHNVQRKVLAAASDPTKAKDVLSEAFSVLQKSRGVLHRNAVRRKMSRMAKAVAKAAKAKA